MSATLANHSAIPTPGKSLGDISPFNDSRAYLETDSDEPALEDVLEIAAIETSDITSVPASGPDQDFEMKNVEDQTQRSSQPQHYPPGLETLIQERDALQKDLHSANRCIEDMEETLDYRQKELQLQEKKAAKAEQQFQVCKKDLEKHKEEITRLQQEMEKRTTQWKRKLGERQKGEQAALKQLGDAHNHIFRLQPRRTDITETEAQELFNDLFNSVQRWVCNRLERILDMLEDGKLRTRVYPRDAARKVVQLTSARAMQGFNFDQSDEHFVIAVIMRFLCWSFFSRSFYCPLTMTGEHSDATVFLNRIEQLMRTVPRDGSQCRDWRVEALLAIMQEPGFVERRAHHERQKTIELYNLLEPLVPSADLQELTVSIGRSMVRPAMDLAHRLQLAATVFSLEWTSFNDDLSTGHIGSSTTDFSYFTSLNLKEGGKIVVPPNPADPGSLQTLNMTYLFDVAPGLYSRSPDGEGRAEVKTISKPRVLVDIADDLHAIPKEGPTLLRWIEEESRREARRDNDVTTVPISAGGGDTTKRQSMRNKLSSFRGLRKQNPAG
ncbi:hypothetical protein K505DRAFT_377574 [Melanomma pulvis-pyrius CBS 109.77]|uniref:Uncharacterized protein n=1 Tax=Melanomma pulvis-pyrius CBS 109.77 TaxID=1314802 RepID=A0A6A6X364_9PLEO|nr:hypothetical protein K505DRAFT_377574 [Melanomma pulvis-pyrius CBS 109.77]